MKRLIVLTTILSLSLTAFSQTDTNNKEKVKCFPVHVAKQIAKDLLKGDSAMAELKLVNEQLVKTEEKVLLKDSVISTMVTKEKNYISIIDAQDKKYTVMEDYSKKLEFQLKKEKVKNKFTSILSGVAVLVLGTLLIVH
jgi:hypothetical protein